MPVIGANKPFGPFWETRDHELVRLYLGDVLEVLDRLPEKSVQTVVTSPPYWALRDYQTNSSKEIGKEETPEDFILAMVRVFTKVARVLRDDGTVWLNLGDSYLSNGNLAGIPWRVAFALQKQGWILRQDIVWAKPSPMPESVKNRCTKAHEYIFLLAKQMGYFYDAERIKEKSIGDGIGTPSKKYQTEAITNVFGKSGNQGNGVPFGSPMANKRSVWSEDQERTTLHFLGWLKENHPEVMEDFVAQCQTKPDVWRVSSQGYAGAHFATFPEALITPCIKAGTSEKGACNLCGSPWRRIVQSKGAVGGREFERRNPEENPSSQSGLDAAGAGANWETETVGWEPTCECGSGITRACVVLDPFVGSGTTAVVAIENGACCWGIDLSEKYLRNNAIPRIEGDLLSRPGLAPLVPREIKPIKFGKKI